MTDVQSILAAATQLPVEQRMDLIDALCETIPRDTERPLSDEWMAEIERRSAEIDAGTARLCTWEEVKEAARRRNGMDEKS
jgi:putative addiction module component (TIGR02574 family)